MKYHNFLGLFCFFLPFGTLAQAKPLFEVHLQTLGDVRLAGVASGENKGLSKAQAEEYKELFVQWEGPSGLKLLTQKAAIGKQLPPLLLQIPAQYHTYFQTTKGNVQLQQLTGYVEGHSQAGDVYLEQITAQVRLHAKAGNISAANSTLSGELIAPTGDIRLSDVKGSYSALTAQGQVHASFSETFFKDTKKPLAFGFEKGSLRATGAKAGVVFEIKNGQITVQKSRSVVEAVIAEAGDVRLEGVSGQIRARTGKGSIWVETLPETAKEEQNIALENHDGDISLLVPEQMQGLWIIEATQTRDLEKKNTVTSDMDWGKADWQEQRGSKDQLVGRTWRVVRQVGERKRIIRIKIQNGNLSLKTY